MREEEETLVQGQGLAPKGRCPKARPSWIQELGQKHPFLAHTAAVAVAVVLEVVAVADIENQVLGGQPELDPGSHVDLELDPDSHVDLELADCQQRWIEKPELGQQAVDGLFEGSDVEVLLDPRYYVGMKVHFAKAAVDVAIVPLVQPVLWVEPVVGSVVEFDLKIQVFVNSAELLLAEALFVGQTDYFDLVTCTAERQVVPLLPDGQPVAEVRQPCGVLVLHGHLVSGLAQHGLIDGEQADFDPELLDARAEEAWAVVDAICCWGCA